MLFDLRSGKRRRVVQIVFGGLALLFAVGFIGFGIGGEQQGGILDAVGLGGDDGGQSTSSTYEQQIEEAEADLEQDPRDEKALTDLARYRFLSGQEQLDFDESTGVATLTDEARSEWNAALDAWERFLERKPKRIDPQVASQMVCVYIPAPALCGVQGPPETYDFDGAIQTQTAIADEDRGPGGYLQLAQFLYLDGRFGEGDEAADEAVSRAAPNEREKLAADLQKLADEARRFEREQRKAQQAGGEEPSLQDPLGGLGGGAGTLPQTTP